MSASLLARWLHRPAPLHHALAERLRAWRALPEPDPRPLAQMHCIAVDLEATGLALARDETVAIGAVAIDAGRIALGETFEIVVAAPRPSAEASILVHGIGEAQQRGGIEPVEAWLAFLTFAGKAPLVAFRAEFDGALIERGLRTVPGLRYRPCLLDVATILPALEPDAGCQTLEDWCARFAIGALDRHAPGIDALIAAQLWLVCLDRGAARGVRTAREFMGLQRAQRWLGRR